MIQIKRGKTGQWLTLGTPLAAGQPGYDKDKNKIKIGDGTNPWIELPYATGLNKEEILSPEEGENGASRRFEEAWNALGTALGWLGLADKAQELRNKVMNDSPAVITYGTKSPSDSTLGRLYLQEYDSTYPEADYITECGCGAGAEGETGGQWMYHVWHSGVAECWITFEIETSLNTSYTTDTTTSGTGNTTTGGGTTTAGATNQITQITYYNDVPLPALTYPIQFKVAPVEIASVCGDVPGVWIATNKKNSSTTAGVYSLAYPASLSRTSFSVSLMVRGIVSR